LTVCAGYAVLRCLALAKGPAALGLAPSAGLALTTVVSTWSGSLGFPPPIAGLLVVFCAAVGIGLVAHDRSQLAASLDGFRKQDPLAAASLAAAIGVELLSLTIAFGGVQAPLSPHDGAFHVETSDEFRHATAHASWYPPGLAALFGAALQALPWVDTAFGATYLGLGITLVIPVAIFGLASLLSRDLLTASLAALFSSLTYLLTYYPQMWSGWPQLLGIVLVLGLWVVATLYIERPSWQLTVLAGLLVGAVIVVHGTELYTSALVLSVVALANWRRLGWVRLGAQVPVAIAVALVCAAPYLPLLLHWAGGGGAFDVGLSDAQALASGSKTNTAADLLWVFGLDAIGVDLPVRLPLVILGVGWALWRRTGRIVVALAVAFIGLAVIATFFSTLPAVRQVYATTYPWSLPYRQLTFAVVPLTLLAGVGAVRVMRGWSALRERARGVATRRRLERTGRLLVVAWLLVATTALTNFLLIPRRLLSSFGADDAAAMTWLSENRAPGEVLANDTYADAGIWAPYKAHVAILVYRSLDAPGTIEQRTTILANITQLDRQPALAAACALNVRYVYYGAEHSAWQERTFPSVEELRASTGLEEAYSHGQAVVFRTRLPC
jgi:hypothetical protein